MADKKFNAVSTAKDGAYIYAEDSSGNQIKISKADLATVVAENINDILFPTKTYTLQPGEEVDTGFNNYGMYLVRSTSIGRTDLVFIGSSAIGQYTASGNESGFTSDVSSNSGIFVGRKENNGNIFIKNNATASRNVQIKRFRII